MKKRVLSLLMCVALLAGLVVPSSATDGDTDPKYTDFPAADSGTYRMGLYGVAETFYDDVAGITFDYLVQGAEIGSTQSLLMKIDATKLTLCAYSIDEESDEEVTITIGNTGVLTPTGAYQEDLFDGKARAVSQIGDYVTQIGNTIYYMIQPNVGNITTSWSDGLNSLLKFRLAFVGNTTAADLDKYTVQIATVEEANRLNQDDAAVLSDGNDKSWEFRKTTDYDDTHIEMGEPLVIYPNSTVENINATTATVVSTETPTQEVTAINVPASYDSDGKPVVDTTDAVTVVGKAFKCVDATTELTEDEYKDMKWTYNVDVKTADTMNETEIAALKASVASTVSVDSNGKITISSGAPECTLLISVTGQWASASAGNKDRKVTSEAVELQLCHGDAHTKEGGDTDAPGPDDAEATLHGVKIIDADDNQLAISSSTDVGEVYAAASDTVVLKAVEFDQYGDAMEKTVGEWGDNKPGTDGAVDMTALTESDTYAFKYTAGSYSATVNLTITEYNITWGELKSSSLTYGEKLEIVGDEKATKDGSEVEGVTFGWEDNNDTLDAGTTKAVRVCYVNDTPVAKKQYSVTVDKADQKITIVGDTATEQITDFALDLDNETSLETTVTNATIEEEIKDAIVNYSVSPDNVGISVNSDKDTITGTINQARATLTITAEATDNYNEANRVVTVSVVRLLHANITFSPDPDPETGATGVVFGNTIEATISDDVNQKGSLVGCTYNWGYYAVDAETGETKFFALTEAAPLEAVEGTDGIYTQTVSYHATAADIDRTLVVQVITPTTKPDGYDYYDSITASMKQPIARQPNEKKFSDFGTLEVLKTTKNSVIVNYIEGAEYAIVKKDADAPASSAYESNATYSEEKNSVVAIKGDDVVEPTKTKDTGSGSEEGLLPPVGGEDPTTNGSLTAIDNDGDDTDEPKTDANDGTQTETPENGEGTGSEGTDTTEPTTGDSNNNSDSTDSDDATALDGYRFLTLSDGETKLDPDTEYVVYARIKANSLVAASEPIKIDAKTRKIGYLDPADEGGPNPALTAASVKLDGEAKVGSTLTAEITDENVPKLFTVADPDVADSKTTVDIKWYRVAADGTETEIESARGSLTYTIGNDDMGDKIKVEISLNDQQKWDGVITATTEDAVPSGYNITGKVKSYNATNAVTYALYLPNEDGSYPDLTDTAVKAATKPAYSGVAVAAADTTGTSMAVQEFVIENVPDGTYMLVLSKPAHLDITIKDVKVEGGDLALSTEGDTTDKDGTYLLFGAGDLDGNGRINVNDMNMVTASSTYNKTSEQAANKIADIDGSGTINVTDKNIISSTNNYNKASGQFTYKAINQN